MFERGKMMKKSMIGSIIGIAVCLPAVNAMAAAFKNLIPTNPASMGEPAVLLFNGILLIGLGYFLRNRING
jgi:CBS-domain-containing membrane protein